jgi:hypothetical protein
MIAQTITGLVALRKEIINDIYQIMGLSDIMRGATDPQETLGAQQLKTQYGSTRIRDKQQELVRLARDLVEITTEIITEKFDPVTIIAMSQTELPTQAMQRKQVMQIQQQMQNQQLAMQKMAQLPQAQAQLQQNPQAGQQVMQQGQQLQQQGQAAIASIMEKPTLEQVLYFLKDHRAKAFTLDIETDSTIQVDEDAEKQRRTEFTQMLGQLLPQLAQMITADPATASFCGELLKFTVAPFRTGRSLDAAIDELVEQMKQKAGQPMPNPEAEKTKALVAVEQEKNQIQREKNQADNKNAQDEIAAKSQHEQQKLQNNIVLKQMELSARQGDLQSKAQLANQKAMADREDHQMDMIGKQQDLRNDQQKMALAQQQSELQASDMAQRQQDRRNAQQFRERQAMFRPPNGR